MPPAPPTCPRCGYDQTGAIASWNREDSPSCPLRGRCSECGLEFRWHDVIYADRLIVHGFVEHARGFWQTWRWAWVTWAWTLWPPVFWRKVRMEHAPRMKWCLIWLALLVVPIHIGQSVLSAISLWVMLMDQSVHWLAIAGPEPRFAWLNVASVVLEPIVHLGEDTSRSRFSPGWYYISWNIDRWPDFLPLISVAAVAFPLTVLILPATRRRAKVQISDVFRSAVYGFAWLLPPVIVWELMSTSTAIRDLISSTRQAARTMGGTVSWWFPALEAPYESLTKHWSIWMLGILVWLFWWWRRAIRQLFEGHSPGSVFLAAVCVSSLCVLIAIFKTPSYVEWVLSVPGAHYFYPSK